MRLPRTARGLLAACALGAAAVAAAPAVAAPGDPIVLSGPGPGAQLAGGNAPALRARGVPGDAGLELRAARSAPPVDACGRSGTDVAQARGTPRQNDVALYDYPTG